MARVNYMDLCLLAVWLILFRTCYYISYADPSSYFFDKTRAYERPHSALREVEATQFLSRAAAPTDDSIPNLSPPPTDSPIPSSETRICIGVPSIKREKENFLGQTIGSLVDTLSDEERRSITLIVLLVDEDATQSPYYGAGWLDTIPDIVLTYANEEEQTTSLYQRLPAAYTPESPRNVRARVDNAMLISACQDQPADYFLLIEDDVIASRDWLLKLKSSIGELEDKNLKRDWLFLRLFHTELYLGWNTEEYPKYVAYISVVWTMVALVVLLQRQLSLKLNGKPLEPTRAGINHVLSIRLIAWLFAFTTLYFLAGRQVVQPLQPGVQEMPRYGCCGQGLLFPSRNLHLVKQELLRPIDEPVDSCISRIAEEEQLGKWAIVPSVLQHIGVRGSSSKDGARKKTWSFGFEQRRAY